MASVFAAEKNCARAVKTLQQILSAGCLASAVTVVCSSKAFNFQPLRKLHLKRIPMCGVQAADLLD